MYRLVAAFAVVVAAFVVGGHPASATGNGAPSGPHFTLNIHGVANGQGFNGNNQNDIFVPLQGNCQIDLYEGSFGVTQPDCVNNSTASFDLPNPDPTNSGTSVYSVYARALGKPLGSSTTTACFIDSGVQYCSVYQMVLDRKFGPSTFDNVTKDLLYVYYCSNGKTVRSPLFSDPTGQYYWQYDNQGLRLAQLRFYPGVQTTVPAAGQNC